MWITDGVIDAVDIALVGEAGRYTGQLRIASIASFADGHTRNSEVFPLDVHYTSQQREQVLKAGIPFTQNI